MSLIEEARDFARQKHEQQQRKYSGEPYFNHLRDVAEAAAAAGLSDYAVAAAWLHDVVEDQPVTIGEIELKFGPSVAEIVAALTDTPTVKGGPNRAARKVMDRARLAAAGAEAQTIKCADLANNTSTIVMHDEDFARVYLPEKRATLQVLAKADPKMLKLAWTILENAEQYLGITDENIALGRRIHLRRRSVTEAEELAGVEGIEPSFAELEAAVLPLDETPMVMVLNDGIEPSSPVPQTSALPLS